jgi:hypothetical protein
MELRPFHSSAKYDSSLRARPHLGKCLTLGRRTAFNLAAHLGTALLLPSNPRFGHWHSACILSDEREAAGRWSETDSAANHYGQSAAENPRHKLRVQSPVLPLAFLGSLDRRATMSTFDTLPGESSTSIISSIINLVCPQCGGRMSEFQCEGRCRRNWLAEWEWANQATRRSESRSPHNATGLMHRTSAR